MIIESVLTTVDARGVINFAPMGVEWGEEEIVIKPFLETTTFKNLEATRVAVINLTDDVMVFAQGAIANVQFPARWCAAWCSKRPAPGARWKCAPWTRPRPARGS